MFQSLFVPETDWLKVHHVKGKKSDCLPQNRLKKLEVVNAMSHDTTRSLYLSRFLYYDLSQKRQDLRIFPRD